MSAASSQALAQRDFSRLSFFILTGLEEGAEFGYDSKLFIVKSFTGVKLLTPGLHLFVFSASPSSNDTPETISGGVGVRHGLLRFFGTGETVVEEWDNLQEELKEDVQPRKRRRIAEKTNDDTVPLTVVSEEYLKSLDKTLAPYSKEVEKEWTPLTSYITRSTVLRVVGLDERGNARVDAVMGSTADEDELKAAVGKMSWGKERPPELQSTAGEEEDEVELLAFVAFDGKRSWPPGAVGQDLTRWSKDKSWLLSQVVASQLNGDVQELLAELQLSFVLFTFVHNFSSLSAYKALFALLCRSSSVLLPAAAHPQTPHSATLLTSASLPLYASFLSLFHAQLSYLSSDFFSNHMPGLDLFLLAELDILCHSLSDALPHWTATQGSSQAVWKTLIERWDQVCVVAMERFGWQLDMVKGSKERAPEAKRIVREMEEEGYVDFEDLEEGEDAPVIVEM